MTEMTVPLVSRGNGRWGSPSPAWDALIVRESSGIPDIVQQITDVNSGGNEAEGLFQITPTTWREYRGEEFAPSARRATPQQQAVVAARVLAGQPGAWGFYRHPGREDPAELRAGLVPLDQSQENPMPAVVSGDPVWLEDVWREALGDRLVVEDGWKDHGAGGFMGVIWGTMIHHTGNDNERVAIIRDGVQQPSGWLPGPLSQALITRDGKLHLIAVGPCNHAGSGNWKDLTDGNRQAIGIECAYDGDPLEWPREMILTMRDAAAAVSKKIGKRADDSVCGHKEYAKPQGRKIDPANMSMDWFRGEVQKRLDGFVFPGEDPITPPVVVDPPVSEITTPPNALALMYDQTTGRWEMLGWRTQVEMLAAIGQKLGIEGSDPTLRGMVRGAKPTS